MSARRGTYSIVARDPATGELGVAVQSHWFAVGSVVAWARAGVGAVATQSIPDPGYGERLLGRLARGSAPAVALEAELAGDEQARFRQLGVVAASGEAAAHTGDGCIEAAGHAIGHGFAAQGNLMASERVWGAMAEAYTGADGPLARRLLTALEAADAAGGDVRGRQSSALLVVPGAGEPWQTTVDLRVEDSPDPLGELRRLVELADAYELAELADEAIAEGRHDDAAGLFRRAAEIAPDRAELSFWSGLGLAARGDVDAGAEQVEAAIAAHAGWRELLARLTDEVAPGAGAMRERIGIEPRR